MIACYCFDAYLDIVRLVWGCTSSCCGPTNPRAIHSYYRRLGAIQSYECRLGAIQSDDCGSEANPILCCGPGVHVLYMYFLWGILGEFTKIWPIFVDFNVFWHFRWSGLHEDVIIHILPLIYVLRDYFDTLIMWICFKNNVCLSYIFMKMYF